MTEYLQRAPFVRILLPYLAGIFTDTGLGLYLTKPLLLLLLILFGALIPAGLRRNQPGNTRSGWLFTFFFFLLGMFISGEHHQPRSHPSANGYLVTLAERPVEKNRSMAAQGRVTGVHAGDSSFAAPEKISLFFPKDTVVASLQPGQRIYFSKQPQMIENQGNPFEFDYKGYAARNGFDRQVFLKQKEWIPAGTDPAIRLAILAEKTRNYLLDIYRRNGLSGNEFDVLSALTLGYRKSMDPAVTSAFAATGSTHVLSVSGLHVGIVYLMFTLAFGFLKRRKSTRLIFLVMAVFTLWIYSFITGMSPPVMRSALMFTIVLSGENLRRPANIYNTLAASAFLILIMDPNLVFDVGFQLSYVALFGIVFFQPRLDALLDIPFKPVRYLWGLLTVSIGAQLTTFPLSCYYFNQFPSYFWLSGFLVIPLSFVFIFLGMLILAISHFPVICGFLAKTAGILVKFMIGGLQWMQELPGSLIRGFNFPLAIMLIAVASVLCLMLFMETRKLFWFRMIFLFLIAGFLTGTFIKVRQNHQQEIIAYHTTEPVIHLVFGRSDYLLTSASLLKENYPEWLVKPVMKHLRLKDPVVIPFEEDYSDNVLIKKRNILFFNGSVLCIQNGKVPAPEKIKPDVLILDGTEFLNINPSDAKTVISYSRYPPANAETSGIYCIAKKGAWRCSNNFFCHKEDTKSQRYHKE
jgi:competence protein ComEC